VDINQDGVVDMADYKRMEDYYGLGLQTAQVEKSDVNGDGQVDAGDYKSLSDAIDHYWRADQNRDGRVDANDLDRLRQIVQAVKKKNVKPQDIIDMDLVRDGQIDEGDIQKIEQMISEVPKFDINKDKLVNLQDVLGLFAAWGTDPLSLLNNYAQLMEDLLAQARLAMDAEKVGALADSAARTAEEANEVIRIAREVAKLLKSPTDASKLIADASSSGGRITAAQQAIEAILKELEGQSHSPKRVDILRANRAAAEETLSRLKELGGASRLNDEILLVESLISASREIDQTITDLLAASPDDEALKAEKSVALEVLDACGKVLNTLTKARDDFLVAEKQAADVKSESHDLKLAAETLLAQMGQIDDGLVLEAIEAGLEGLISRLEDSYVGLQDTVRRFPLDVQVYDAMTAVAAELAEIRSIPPQIREKVAERRMQETEGESTAQETEALAREASLLVSILAVLGGIASTRRLFDGLAAQFMSRTLTDADYEAAFTGLLDEKSVTDIAKQWVNGPDSKASSLSQKQYIQGLFQFILRRVPSDDELTDYDKKLTDGTLTRDSLFDAVWKLA